MNMDQLKINEIEKQLYFEGENIGYWVTFTVGGVNEYEVLVIRGEEKNLKFNYGSVGLASGERSKRTLKALERELEKYCWSDDVKDKKKVKEINAILDEWEQVVENIEDIEKRLNDLMKQDPKYRLKVLF